MKRFLVAAVICISVAHTLGQSLDREVLQPQPTVQTDSRKTINGFSGWLLITSEEDFDVELDMPAQHARSFSDADQVRVGEKILIMVLFANPQTFNGAADVLCDITVTKPDQTISMAKPKVQCMKSRPPADKDDRYMAGMIIRFIAEEADPKGDWTVNVSLRDRVRGTEILLKKSFNLE